MKKRLLHRILDLAGLGNIALVLKVGHEFLGVVVGDRLFFLHLFGVGLADDLLNGGCLLLLNNLDHLLFDRLQFFGNDDLGFCGIDLSGFGDCAAGFQRLNNRFRLLSGNGPFHRLFLGINHPAEQTDLQNTELHAGLGFDFLLQRLGKLRKALVCHYVQNIDILILDPVTVLIDA